MKAVLEAVLREAKNKSEDFSELYREIYYGGSYYDKLKVKSTDYEYDLNVVFKQPKSSVHISNLGDDYRYTLMYIFIVEAESHIFHHRKPNFATIGSNSHNSTPAWKKLLKKDRQNSTILSPKEMFKVLNTAVDRAITELKSKVLVGNEEYRLECEYVYLEGHWLFLTPSPTKLLFYLKM